MSSSGVSTSEYTRDAIVARALRIVRAQAPGEPMAAHDLATATEALNAMIQAWAAMGPARLPWTRYEKSFPLPTGKDCLTVGPGGDVDMPRPHRVMNLRVGRSGTTSPVLPMSDAEFDALPSPTEPGDPRFYVFRPEIPVAKIDLFPVVATAGATLLFVVGRPLYDFTGAKDTPDFPREIGSLLVWSLAAELVPEYPVSAATAQRIDAMVAGYMKAAFGD